MTDVNYALTSPTPAGSIALAFCTALAGTPPAWPEMETGAYEIYASNSSYSEFASKIAKQVHNAPDSQLAQAVTHLYSNLLSRQQPLGSQFERVWDENEESLYDW